MAKQPPTEPAGPTFEESLAQLEGIVRDIEEGKIGLEESIKRYEEGTQLLAHCRKILSQAELKIKTLQAQSQDDEPPAEESTDA